VAPAALQETSLGLEEARRFCRRLARVHYENFPVGRFGFPAAKRPHIHAVYAFARIADDYADDPKWEGQRLERLREWGDKLEKCLCEADHPVFVALADTISRLDLSLEPFRDLLGAFRQDAAGHRYGSWEEVLDYCSRSAAPVGRLVLKIAGRDEDRLLPLSDRLCAALQLTNFWQDLSVDLPRGRCYLPQADAARFGVNLDSLIGPGRSAPGTGSPVPGLAGLLELETERTNALFEESRGLPGLLKGRLGVEIAATWLGGRMILERAAELRERALLVRPSLGFFDKALVLVRALGGRV
jgi:squalene synthase HpnC